MPSNRTFLFSEYLIDNIQKDQLRNKEFIDKLDGTTNRVVEDLNNMLRTMQNDFQGRLENRVT